MSFFGHLGKSSSSYVALVQVHECAPVSSVEALHCVLTRGKKAQQTRMAMADGKKCVWDEVVPVLLTLYAKKQTKPGVIELDKKVYTFVVQTDRSAKRSSLSLSAGSGPADARAQRLQLSVDIDLAAFAAPDAVGKEVTRSFALQGAPSGVPTPALKLTIKVAPVKKGATAAAAAASSPSASASGAGSAKPLGLHASKHSISISAVSPLAAQQRLDSFAQNTDDNDTQRQRRTVPRTETTPADADVPPDEQARDVYGELEDEPAATVQTRVPRGSVSVQQQSQSGTTSSERPVRSPLSVVAAAAHSYMATHDEGEDNVSALSPGRTLYGITGDSPSGASSRRGSVLSPAERKRRSETQIFSSIMVNEINSSAAMMHGGGADAAAPPLPPSATPSRRTSVLAPSDSARRLYVSTASEHELAALGRKPTESSAGVQRTPQTGTMGDGALDSYAADFSDDEAVALTLPPQDPNRKFNGGAHELDADGDADSDDAGAGTGALSSFADRNHQLTVDDILSPGFGDAATASSARSAGDGAGSQARHARRISMFTEKAEGQAQLDSMLRPQLPRANSVIKNFFSSGKASTAPPDVAQALAAARDKASSARKINTGRSGPGMGNDSQPASAASPRTPKLSETVPASMFFSYSSGAAVADPVVPRKPKQRDVDQQGEKSVSGLSAQSAEDLLHTGGSSLDHPSRQASRSPSPSRSTGSGASGGGGGHSAPPPASTLASHSSLSLPGPSPRTGKPSFPHSSPAKHSTAHLVSRTSRTSPFSSLSKEDSARLTSAQPAGGGGGALLVPDGAAEVGSLASYRAAMKHRKMKSSSRSNSGTPYGSLQLQNESAAAASQAYQAASRTMPRAMSNSSLGGPTPPSPHPGSSPSPHSRPAAGNRSLSKEASMALSAPRSPPAPVSLAEAAQQEKEFHARTLPAVEQLCEQLHVPDLFDGMASPAPSASPSSVASASPSATGALSPPPSTPAKSLWGSLKKLATPSHSSAGQSAAAATAAAAPPSPSSSAGAASASDACNSFYFGVPVWSCTVLRCLSAWDAFGVSSFLDERDPSQLQRTAARSWILSTILTHVHNTGLFLCARSAAGQRQNALCFFIAHVATLIQLVEAYSRSPHAPAPFPVLEDRAAVRAAARGAAASAAAASLYERSILVPLVPTAFLSSRGLVAIPQLPLESSQRVCEVARSKLRSSKRDSMAGGAASSAGSASRAAPLPVAPHYPYDTTLGVSTYSWFLSHLRAQLATAYQCVLELTLTELEMVDPASILSSCNDAPAAGSDEVGYESTLEQLLSTYQKLADDLSSNRVGSALRVHLFACLFAHLNATLFNTLLASSAHMHMTCAMRLKIICTGVKNWAHNAADGSGGGSSAGVPSPEETALEQVCDAELAMCQQLAVLMLSDKRSLTLTDLAALCPALTPVSLYHLLLNYRGPGADGGAAGAGRDPDDECTEELLEGLSNYMMQLAASRTTPMAPSALPLLFPTWNGAAATAATDAAADSDDDDEDDTQAVYGAHARAARTASTGPPIQSPFLDAFAPIPLPSLSTAAASSPRAAGRAGAASPVVLLPLASVPVPGPLQSDPAFAFLQRGGGEQLVLPVSRGAE